MLELPIKGGICTTAAAAAAGGTCLITCFLCRLSDGFLLFTVSRPRRAAATAADKRRRAQPTAAVDNDDDEIDDSDVDMTPAPSRGGGRVAAAAAAGRHSRSKTDNDGDFSDDVISADSLDGPSQVSWVVVCLMLVTTMLFWRTWLLLCCFGAHGYYNVVLAHMVGPLSQSGAEGVIHNVTNYLVSKLPAASLNLLYCIACWTHSCRLAEVAEEKQPHQLLLLHMSTITNSVFFTPLVIP